MIQASVPELADGGYWYVAYMRDSEPFAPDLGFQGWTATDGLGFCAVRTPDPVANIDSPVGITVTQVLSGAGYSSRPRGRVRGQ